MSGAFVIGSRESQRADKWLWHARFLKSRTLAAKLCEDGKVRQNGEAFSKSSQQVHIGDVLTFPQGRQIRVVKIQAIAKRRGPAAEAATLYEDLSPQFRETRSAEDASPASRERGSGRPTKRDRRALDRLKDEAADNSDAS